MWRERVEPPAPEGAGRRRRRTPRLRREELAEQAGISVDYVVRLEQDRAPTPSASVLDSLAGALGLSDAETDHLYTLAGVARARRDQIDDAVRGSVQRLFERMPHLPAMILNARGDVLCWNSLAAAVHGDFAAVPEHRRTHLWLHFVAEPGFTTRLVTDQDSRAHIDRSTVAAARLAQARHPHDQRLRLTIEELRQRSPRFSRLWDERPVEYRYSEVKTYDVPGIGLLTLDCESLLVPDDDQTLVLYSAVPGSSDADKLDRMREGLARD